MNTNENPQTMEDESLHCDVQSSQPAEEMTQAQDNTQDTETAPESPLSPEEQWQKPLDELQAQLDEQKDKYLRLAAEFDNFRRRTAKEKAELTKTGGAKAITAVLPVIDDMERAIENALKTSDIEALTEGLNLIYQKFLKVLGEEGLEKMSPKDEPFDTDFHEAIAMVPAADEAQKGKVLDCVQTGYKLNDKVIRHAKVVVAQ